MRMRPVPLSMSLVVMGGTFWVSPVYRWMLAFVLPISALAWWMSYWKGE